MTVKLFGCSFTNWIYPTWADFVKLHYAVDVEIYGKPGIGNQTLKKLLFMHSAPGDYIAVMFSGNDRQEHGIDLQYVGSRLKEHIKDPFWVSNFASKDKMFVPVNKEFSLFHLLYTQAETIVDIQNYLAANNNKYFFMSWQNLFSDLSKRRDRAGLGKPVSLSNYFTNDLFNRVYKLIQIDRFADDYPLGLLDYIHNNKSLFLYQNSWDFHPSCLAHFCYFVDYIKPVMDQQFKPNNNLDDLRIRATALSEYYRDCNCTDDPFNAPNGDNEFVKHKFHQLRAFMIEKFFRDFDQLTKGYYYG